MGFQIITADQRLAQHSGIKGQIWGPFGIGKTSLLWTLPGESTLAVDLEAGLLAVQGWQGDSISVRTWEDCRDIACLIGGPNPSLRDDQAYSPKHYEYCLKKYNSPDLSKYDTIFIDSTTNAGRYCLQWAKGQPQAFSDRSGKPDMRGAYGLLGSEMIAWVNQWQHIPDLNCWLVGGLSEKVDDFNRTVVTPLLDGTKSANELPYIVDEVITMAELKTEDGRPYRALVCGQNPWGYPSKDRSGRLSMVEEPHLGRLMEKIKTGKRTTPNTYTLPTTPKKEATNV